MSIFITYTTYSNPYRTDQTFVIGYMIGRMISASLICMSIFYPFWKWAVPKSFPENTFKAKRGCALLCYSTLLLLCTSFQSRNVEGFNDQIKKPESTLSELKSIIQSNDEFAPLMKIANEVMEFNEQEDLKFNAIIEEINVDDLLDFNNLINPLALKSNVEKLDVIQKKFTESQQRVDDNALVIDNKIKSFAAKLATPERFLKSYNEGKKPGMDLKKERYQVLIDITKKIRNLLNFLITVQGTYSIENEHLIFEEDESVDKFNAYFSSILELFGKEEDILKRISEYEQNLSN
jgi:hypothetical protein